MFICSTFNKFLIEGNFEKIDGALLTFESNDPKYSFLKLNDNGNVIKTVEKEAISNKAICGAYYFKNKEIFLKNSEIYLKNCQYREYFISGVYNSMASNDLIIKNFDVDLHIAFGTPEEYEEALTKKEFLDLKDTWK